MICEKCKKNQATTHIRQNINGKHTEMHLCESCAAEITESLEYKYGKIFSDFGFGIDSMLGSMFGQEFLGENLLDDEEERCPMCGSTLSRIRETGNVGCSKCYETFRSQLTPFIQRIHGKTTHNGKTAKSAEEKIGIKEKISSLETELKKSIDAQEFENAAKLRDEINELKKGL